MITLDQKIATRDKGKGYLKDKIKEFICHEIKSSALKHGDKIPPQRKLAKMFEVSCKTAEVAMHELELENVIERRQGRGSFVCGKAPEINYRTQSQTVALCVPNLNNEFFSYFAEVVERELFKHHINTIIARSSYLVSENKRYISMFRNKSVDAIIGFTLHPSMIDYADKNNIPYINISPKSPEFSSQIVFDFESAGKQIVDYLVGHGHKKIVCAGAPDSVDPRFQIIGEELARRNIELLAVIPQSLKNLCNIDYEEIGCHLAEKILEHKELPSAIIFYNDHRALGAMKAFIKKGFRIPEDFSIIGFDNIPMGKLFIPSLSTVDYNIEFAAKIAVRKLINCDFNINKKTVIEPQLLLRESSMRAKN